MKRDIEIFHPSYILRGEREIRRFEERIEADLKRPAALTPTPKLEKAREMVLKYAVKKRIK